MHHDVLAVLVPKSAFMSPLLRVRGQGSGALAKGRPVTGPRMPILAFIEEINGLRVVALAINYPPIFPTFGTFLAVAHQYSHILRARHLGRQEDPQLRDMLGRTPALYKKSEFCTKIYCVM